MNFFSKITATISFALVMSGLFKIQPSNASSLIISDVVYEFKETYELTIIEPIIEEVPSLFTYRLFIDVETGQTRPGQLENISNKEIVGFDVNTYAFDLYNIYVSEITFDGLFVDLFWIIGSDNGEGISSLPNGIILEQASMFGANTNTEFIASITQINNLSNLPTSSANNSSIEWDLSEFSDITGDFFLAQTTLPISEIQKTTEASNLLGLSILSIIILGYKALSTYKDKQ